MGMCAVKWGKIHGVGLLKIEDKICLEFVLEGAETTQMGEKEIKERCSRGGKLKHVVLVDFDGISTNYKWQCSIALCMFTRG